MDDDSMDEFGQWWDDADFEQEMIVGEGDLPDPSVMSRLEKGRFACTFTGCDKSYSHRRQCEDHYTSIHLNHPRYRCDACNKTFSFKENWNSHNKNTHDGNVIRTPQVNGMSVSMLPSSSAGFSSSSGRGGRNNNAAMVNANNHNSTPTSGNLLHTRLLNGNVNNNNNSNSHGKNGHHHHHHNNQHQNNSKNNNHTSTLHRSSSTPSHIRPQAMKPSRDLIPTPPPLHKLWTVSPPVVSASSHNHQHASPTAAGGGGGSSTSVISSSSTPISVSSVQPVVPQPPLKLVLRLPTLEPAPSKKAKHEENSNISTSVITSTSKYSESAGEGSALSTCISSGVQKLEVCPPNQTKACFKCKCCEGFFLSRVLFERHVNLKSEEQAAQDASSSSSSPTTKSPPSCSSTTSEVKMEIKAEK